MSESYEWGELTRERYMQMKEDFKKFDEEKTLATWPIVVPRS